MPTPALNNHRATSPLQSGWRKKTDWRPSDPTKSVLPHWGGTEPNRTATCMVLKTAANDRVDGDDFAQNIDAEDETWCHHFQSEIRQHAMGTCGLI
ncbi:hypothetical protein TNCV_335431 [Trichonephila clavipes]|nr:hypothetical protein TNCV_335431 [Trichonephila clavipes]